MTFIFQPLTKIKASERVEREIKRAILDGHLIPGSKLPPEAEMSKQFNVSRSTIREAFRSLSTLGILEIAKGPGKGAVVSDHIEKVISENISFWITLKNIPVEKLLELRMVIEAGAVELAAVRADETDLEKIKDALESIDYESSDVEKIIESSFQFHLAIIEATKNPILRLIVSSIRDAIRQSITTNIYSSPDPSKSILDHRSIYEAIKMKDPSNAKSLMSEHLQTYKNRINTKVPYEASRAAEDRS